MRTDGNGREATKSATNGFQTTLELLKKVHYQPERGEYVQPFSYRVGFRCGDNWVIRFNGKYYVATPAYRQAHGGELLSALIESFSYDEMEDAIDALFSFQEAKAKHCATFGNE